MPSDRRLNRAFATVRDWLDGLLSDARVRLKAEPDRANKPSNFIEAMLTSVDEDGKPFSHNVIMSNLITMLLAGEDTTASHLRGPFINSAIVRNGRRNYEARLTP